MNIFLALDSRLKGDFKRILSAPFICRRKLTENKGVHSLQGTVSNLPLQRRSLTDNQVPEPECNVHVQVMTLGVMTAQESGPHANTCHVPQRKQ